MRTTINWPDIFPKIKDNPMLVFGGISFKIKGELRQFLHFCHFCQKNQDIERCQFKLDDVRLDLNYYIKELIKFNLLEN